MTTEIVHVSPTYFSSASLVGGGERFPVELARAMAEQCPTRLLTFGPRASDGYIGRCALQILHGLQTPGTGPLARLNVDFVRLLRRAAVVHVHQFRSPIGQCAIVAGRILHKKVFITDHGGRVRGPLGRTGAARFADGLIAVSEYSAAQWAHLRLRSHVVYAGADERLLSEPTLPGRDGILIVGRILPHKRIDLAIDALAPGMRLTVLGRPYSPQYLRVLRSLAKGKDVAFITDADDSVLVMALRQHLILVMASSDVDAFGRHVASPELLGTAVVEGMVAGLAVVVSDLPPFLELVRNGDNGLVFRRHDGKDLAAKLKMLYSHPEVATALGAKARELARCSFTWPLVAQRCLSAYGAGR